MKVKLLVGRAGDNFVQEPGDMIEVTQTEGERLIELGRAELVVVERETATAKPAEKRAPTQKKSPAKKRTTR